MDRAAVLACLALGGRSIVLPITADSPTSNPPRNPNQCGSIQSSLPPVPLELPRPWPSLEESSSIGDIIRASVVASGPSPPHRPALPTCVRAVVNASLLPPQARPCLLSLLPERRGRRHHQQEVVEKTYVHSNQGLSGIVIRASLQKPRVHCSAMCRRGVQWGAVRLLFGDVCVCLFSARLRGCILCARRPCHRWTRRSEEAGLGQNPHDLLVLTLARLHL